MANCDSSQNRPWPSRTGKRIPGLKLDHPRQLALMHALVRFAHIAGGNAFTAAEGSPRILAAARRPLHPRLASLRPGKAQGQKGLVAKLPRSRRYQLLPRGYSICLSDRQVEQQRRSQLDRLYQRVVDDIDALVQAVGLKAA